MRTPTEDAPTFSAEFEGEKIRLEVSDGKSSVVLKLSTTQIRAIIVGLAALVRDVNDPIGRVFETILATTAAQRLQEFFRAWPPKNRTKPEGGTR